MPKNKKVACKHCGRKFSMAAHLARHSRVHNPKRATIKRRVSAARGSVRAAAAAAPFMGLVSSLQDSHRALVAERHTVSSQIAALESALNAIGGNGATRIGYVTARAAGNGTSPEFRPGSLKDYIHRALSKSGTPRPVAKIAAGVVPDAG